MRRMCSASIWSSVSRLVDLPGAVWGGVTDLRRQMAQLDHGPEARMTPRSTALRSSRMLPGQA